jgi:RimJ/RimL family protein N-acetyltransferase
MNSGLTIRPITTSDAEIVSTMLLRQSEDYIRYFQPFDFSLNHIQSMLTKVDKDIFTGVFLGENLVGLFFLRGWDEGYSIPAYGVVIDQEFCGIGLGRVTLAVSKALCKLRSAPRLMLKVHPSNLAAKHLYEASGFVQSGTDPKNDNLIYFFDFT